MGVVVRKCPEIYNIFLNTKKSSDLPLFIGSLQILKDEKWSQPQKERGTNITQKHSGSRTSRVSHPPKSVIQSVIWRLRFVTCPGKNCWFSASCPAKSVMHRTSVGAESVIWAVIRTPKSQHSAWDRIRNCNRLLVRPGLEISDISRRTDPDYGQV